MGLRNDVVDVSLLDRFGCPVGKNKLHRVRFVECDSDPSEDAWLPFAEANQLSAMDEYLDLPQNRKLGLA